MKPVLINGKNYDWGNLTWIMFGIALSGITEINYSRTRQSPNNMGAGYEPVGYGYQNFEYSGDIMVYIDELEPIRNAAPNRSILEIPPFSAINMFSGNGITFKTETLRNVRFTEDVFASKQNDSMIQVKVPFTYAGLSK